MAKILLVEDDVSLASAVSMALEFEHHSVEMCHNGGDALNLLTLSKFDLVILDLGLPEVDGVEVCTRIRKSDSLVPIIMTTGRRTIEQKQIGLDSGADDYLTKPFDLRELTARVRSALRRTAAMSTNQLKVRDIVMDTEKHNVTRAGTPLRLRPTDYSLLEYFMRHPDRVFSVEQLLSNVWNTESDATVEAIRSSIKRLRKELDDPSGPISESIIETLHGVGYKLRKS